MKMKESKYPRLEQQEKSDLTELSGVNIEVNERLVGEMWSNVSGEFAPIENNIKKIREKIAAKPSTTKTNKDLKNKN
jgi:hypothetical protein